MKKIILAMIIVIVVIMGGFFAYDKVFAPKTPLEIADPIAGWKTYTNTQYGFQIKYPQEAVISEKNDDLTYPGGETLKIPLTITNSERKSFVTLYIGAGKKNTENCLKFNFYEPNSEIIEKQVVNGETFFTKSQGDAAMGGQRGIITQYSIIKNNICYTINTQVVWTDVEFLHGVTDGKTPTQEEIDNQNKQIQLQKDFTNSIIQTFKFTK